MSNKTALLIGATGLVGGYCLQQLLNSAAYNRVVAIVRKPLAIKHDKLVCLVVDFEKLENYKTELKADDVYCCIGTTIAKAGSQEAFRRVDFDYPKQIAEFALWNGAQKFILVSSMGANATSGIFYSRVKGELEGVLKNMGYKTVLVFRPSILLGDRNEKRTGEAIGQFVADKFSFLFAGPLKKYRGTPADFLAKRMVEEAQQAKAGFRILENDEIMTQTL